MNFTSSRIFYTKPASTSTKSTVWASVTWILQHRLGWEAESLPTPVLWRGTYCEVKEKWRGVPVLPPPLATPQVAHCHCSRCPGPLPVVQPAQQTNKTLVYSVYCNIRSKLCCILWIVFPREGKRGIRPSRSSVLHFLPMEFHIIKETLQFLVVSLYTLFSWQVLS